MKKFIVSAIVAGSVALAASTALAASDQFYVRGDLGYTFSKNLKKFMKTGENAPLNQTRSYGVDASLGLGYNMDENIRTEFAVSLQGSRKLEFPQINLKLRSKTVSYMVNGYYDFANVNDFTPFLTAGLGIAHNTLTNFKSVNNFAYQIGAGVSYKMTDNAALDLTYRFTHAGKAPTKHAQNNVSIDLFNKKLRYHSVMAGIRYSF